MVDKSLDEHTNQPWLRAVLGHAPANVTSAGELLSPRSKQMHDERVEEFLRAVSEGLLNFGELSSHEAFLQTDEFFDLLRDCAEAVARTTSVGKRRSFANLIVSVVKQGWIHPLTQQAADDLKVLHDVHLNILNQLPLSLGPNLLRRTGSSTSAETDRVIDFHAFQRSTGIAWDILNKGRSDLERLGFIFYTSEATVWGGGATGNYRLSRYFHIFEQLIGNGAK